MQTSLAKKLFAVGSAAAMALALMPAFASAALDTPGHNCLSNGTVYFLNAQGQKQPYTSAGAFLSYGFNSWSGVVNCSAEDLALPTGSFVTPADGKFYIDSIDHRTVYLITNGQREGVASAAAFLGLGYSFSNATVADTSFMTTLAPINSSAMAHPAGTLVKLPSGEIDLMGTNGRMGIPSLSVFNSWGYSFKDVVLANSYDQALAMSGGVMPAMVPGYLNPLSVPGNVVITPSSGIAVNLASDTPATGTIVAGQSTADLAHFNFSGSGTVTQLSLNRLGVSANTTLSNVYLFSGNLRITDAASVNSNGQIVFNNASGLFTSPAVISVRADIAASTNGQTVGISVASAMSGSNSIAGNPAGNLMTIAAPGTLTGFTIGTVTNPTGTVNVNAGSLNYTVFSAPLTITSRSGVLKSALFKAIGSAPVDALQNYILYIDGQQVATASGLTAINGSNYAAFTPATGFAVQTGSHTLELRADIIKGSARTIQFSLQNNSDIQIADSQLGVNVTATSGIPANAGTLSIQQGSVTTTIDPTFNSVTNVTGGAANVAIGRFKLTAYGEDVKVNSLTVTPNIASPTFASTCSGSCTSGSMNNVTLYYNGAQVGSSQNFTGTALNFTLGSSLIVSAGSPGTLEVRADLQTNTNINYTGGTVTTNLPTGSSNAQGQSSQNTANVPAASITTNGLTITTGALGIAASPSYANQTVNANNTGVKIGSYVIQNTSTSESVRVTNLAVNLTFAVPTYTSGTVTTGSQAITVNSSAGFTVGNVITIPGATAAIGTVTAVTDATHIQVNITTGGVTPTVGGAITGVAPTVGPAVITNISNLRTSETSGAGSTPIAPQATNNFSVNFTLAPGQTKTIDVLADLGTANLGTVVTSLLPTAFGASSNVVLTPGSATTGQTITLSSGSLATPTLNSVSVGGTLASQFVVGGSSPTLAQFNFTASNGSATITEMKYTISGTATNPITQVCVGSVCAPVVSGIAYLTGLNIAVPNNNAGVNVNVAPTFAPVGVNGVTSNTTAIMTLTFVKYTIGGITTTTTPSVAANTMTVVGTKPSVTLTSSSDSLVNGLVHVADVTVSADPAGDLKLSALPINVTSTGVVTVATGTNNIVVKDASGNTIATTNGTFAVAAGGSSGDVAINFTGNYLIPAGTSKTFSVYVTAATVSGAVNTTSLTTKLGAASGFTWIDQVGGVSGIAGTLIYNYPTNTSVIHN